MCRPFTVSMPDAFHAASSAAVAAPCALSPLLQRGQNDPKVLVSKSSTPIVTASAVTPRKVAPPLLALVMPSGGALPGDGVPTADGSRPPVEDWVPVADGPEVAGVVPA